MVQQSGSASLRDTLAVLVGAARAVPVGRHPAHGAAVDGVSVGAGALSGGERREADAARGRLAAAEAVLLPCMGGAGAAQRLGRGLLLPRGGLEPVERGLLLQPEEAVDERGEADGAGGNEPPEELDPGRVNPASHVEEQRSHQVHPSWPGLMGVSRQAESRGGRGVWMEQTLALASLASLRASPPRCIGR